MAQQGSVILGENLTPKKINVQSRRYRTTSTKKKASSRRKGTHLIARQNNMARNFVLENDQVLVTAVEQTLDLLLRYRNGCQSRFIIAGSFPAYIAGHKCIPQLKFKDLDVYIPTTDGYWQDSSHPVSDVKIVSKQFGVDPTTGGGKFPYNIMEVKKLSLRSLVEGFDINAVRVGFKVRLSGSAEQSGSGKMLFKFKPRISNEHACEEFEKFLINKKLRIIYIPDPLSAANSTISLLHKAMQMNLSYQQPLAGNTAGPFGIKHAEIAMKLVALGTCPELKDLKVISTDCGKYYKFAQLQESEKFEISDLECHFIKKYLYSMMIPKEV